MKSTPVKFVAAAFDILSLDFSPVSPEFYSKPDNLFRHQFNAAIL
jgi:hypothetical protein